MLASLMCARAASFARNSNEPSERKIWCAMGLLLVLLGINEILDLQSLLTAVGRANAKASGWYPQRRPVQFYFVIGLALAALTAGAVSVRLTRRMHASLRLALGGMGFIGLFSLVRAASIHHVDLLLSAGSPMFDWNAILEIAGMLIVGVGAILYGRRFGTER